MPLPENSEQAYLNLLASSKNPMDAAREMQAQAMKAYVPQPVDPDAVSLLTSDERAASVYAMNPLQANALKDMASTVYKVASLDKTNLDHASGFFYLANAYGYSAAAEQLVSELDFGKGVADAWGLRNVGLLGIRAMADPTLEPELLRRYRENEPMRTQTGLGWFTQTLAQAAGSSAAVLERGILGAGTGGAVGLLAGPEAGAVGLAWGLKSGVFYGSLEQNMGLMYADMLAKGIDRDRARLFAGSFGPAMAGLDSFSLGVLSSSLRSAAMKKIMGDTAAKLAEKAAAATATESFAGTMGRKLVVGSLTEAGTEGLQQVLQEYGTALADYAGPWEGLKRVDWASVKENAYAGAVGGLALGFPDALFSSIYEVSEKAEQANRQANEAALRSLAEVHTRELVARLGPEGAEAVRTLLGEELAVPYLTPAGLSHLVAKGVSPEKLAALGIPEEDVRRVRDEGQSVPVDFARVLASPADVETRKLLTQSFSGAPDGAPGFSFAEGTAFKDLEELAAMGLRDIRSAKDLREAYGKFAAQIETALGPKKGNGVAAILALVDSFLDRTAGAFSQEAADAIRRNLGVVRKNVASEVKLGRAPLSEAEKQARVEEGAAAAKAALGVAAVPEASKPLGVGSFVEYRSNKKRGLGTGRVIDERTMDGKRQYHVSTSGGGFVWLDEAQVSVRESRRAEGARRWREEMARVPKERKIAVMAADREFQRLAAQSSAISAAVEQGMTGTESESQVRRWAVEEAEKALGMPKGSLASPVARAAALDDMRRIVEAEGPAKAAPAAAPAIAPAAPAEHQVAASVFKIGETAVLRIDGKDAEVQAVDENPETGAVLFESVDTGEAFWLAPDDLVTVVGGIVGADNSVRELTAEDNPLSQSYQGKGEANAKETGAGAQAGSQQEALDGGAQGRLRLRDAAQDGMEAGAGEALDAEYLRAVEAGDMETASRLVEQAAKAAGFTVEAWHGTPIASLTKFDASKRGINTRAKSATMGFFAAATKETARLYVSPRRTILDEATGIEALSANFEETEKAMASLEKSRDQRYAPFAARSLLSTLDELSATDGLGEQTYATGRDIRNRAFAFLKLLNGKKEIVDAEIDRILSFGRELSTLSKLAPSREINEQIVKGNIKKLFIRFSHPLVHDYEGGVREPTFAELISQATNRGADGAVFKNVTDGGPLDTIYVFFSSDQAKSADPITYDANGKVIPLSERFNPAKESILYQRQGRDAMMGFVNVLEDPSDLIIRLTHEKAGVHTIVHELFHIFHSQWRILAEQFADDPRSKEFIDNLNKFEEAMWKRAAKRKGVSLEAAKQDITLLYEEAAISFEKYLSDGKAPAPHLRSAFEAFSSFIVRAYRWLERRFGFALRDFQIDDRTREMFDRLVVSEEARYRYAETIRISRRMERAAGGKTDAVWGAVNEAVADEFRKIIRDRRKELRTAAAVEVLSRPEYRMMAKLNRIGGPGEEISVSPLGLTDDQKRRLSERGFLAVEGDPKAMEIEEAMDGIEGLDAGQAVDLLSTASDYRGALDAAYSARLREEVGRVLKGTTVLRAVRSGSMSVVENLVLTIRNLARKSPAQLISMAHSQARLEMDAMAARAAANTESQIRQADKAARDLMASLELSPEQTEAAAFRALVAGQKAVLSVEYRERLDAARKRFDRVRRLKPGTGIAAQSQNDYGVLAVAAGLTRAKIIGDPEQAFSNFEAENERLLARQPDGSAGNPAYLMQWQANLTVLQAAREAYAEMKAKPHWRTWGQFSALYDLMLAVERFGRDNKINPDATEWGSAKGLSAELAKVQGILTPGKVSEAAKTLRYFSSYFRGLVFQLEAMGSDKADAIARSFMAYEHDYTGYVKANETLAGELEQWQKANTRWFAFPGVERSTYMARATGVINPSLPVSYLSKLVGRDLDTARMQRMTNDKQEPFAWRFTQVAALLLNRANSYNTEAIDAMFGWEDGTTVELVDALVKDGVITRQMLGGAERIWAAMGSVQGPFFDAMEALNGVRPEAVPAETVVVGGEKLKGGYFPVMFDSRYSRVGEQSIPDGVFLEAGATKLPTFTPKTTGAAKKRRGTGGNAIMLETRFMRQSLDTVARFAAFGKPCNQLMRIVRQADFRDAYTQRWGKYEYTALQQNIARILVTEPIHFGVVGQTVESLAARAIPAAILGSAQAVLNSVMAPFQYSAVNRGPGYAKAAASIASRPSHAVELARRISPIVEARLSTAVGALSTGVVSAQMVNPSLEGSAWLASAQRGLTGLYDAVTQAADGTFGIPAFYMGLAGRLSEIAGKPVTVADILERDALARFTPSEVRDAAAVGGAMMNRVVPLGMTRIWNSQFNEGKGVMRIFNAFARIPAMLFNSRLNMAEMAAVRGVALREAEAQRAELGRVDAELAQFAGSEEEKAALQARRNGVAEMLSLAEQAAARSPDKVALARFMAYHILVPGLVWGGLMCIWMDDKDRRKDDAYMKEIMRNILEQAVAGTWIFGDAVMYFYAKAAGLRERRSVPAALTGLERTKGVIAEAFSDEKTASSVTWSVFEMLGALTGLPAWRLRAKLEKGDEQ